LIDTIIDVGLIVYDIYRIGKDNVFGDCDNLGENLGSLGGNIVGTAMPFATGGGLAVRAGMKSADAASSVAKGIPTPHGIANQANTPAARAALGEVQSGTTVYRQGSFGVQNTADAQFWSLQNPAATRGFANQMGMPGGAAKPDWIMGGTVSPGSPVITRPAPGIGANAGGSMEAVVPSGGVRNTWFHMPD
jgi:hypothetical protein